VPRTPGRRCRENIKSKLSLVLVACLSFHRLTLRRELLRTPSTAAFLSPLAKFSQCHI
jgi:hypothetical protein